MTHAALIQPVVINQSDVKVDNVFIENDFIYIIFVVSRLKVFPCSIHFRRPQNEPFNDHDRQARHMETSTCTSFCQADVNFIAYSHFTWTFIFQNPNWSGGNFILQLSINRMHNFTPLKNLEKSKDSDYIIPSRLHA